MSSQATVMSRSPTHDARSGTSGAPALLVATLVFLAHLPLVVIHFQQLWLKPHYQLFPIVLAGAYVLLWPLESFKFNLPGLLGYANKLMALGTGLLAVGILGESIEGWSFGAPGSWVAAGGVAMLCALPLEILGSPTQRFAGQANPRAGLMVMAISWLVMLFAAFFRAPAITTFSAIAVIASIPITAGGWPLFRRCLPGLAYLLLILPPPFGLDGIFVQKLQFLAAKASSKALDFLGVYHYLNGVTIEVGDKTYMVEQGCSGISSLLSTLACVLFYVLWYRVSWVRGILLTASSIFWVLVNNATRIVGITFFGVGFNLLGRYWSMNLSEGWKHQVFGFVLFALTLFMLWSTDRLLMFFGRSEVPRRRFEPLPASDETLESSWRMTLAQPGAWFRSYGIVAAFGLLAAVQGLDLYNLVVRMPYSGTALAEIYKGADINTMPEKIGLWRRNTELRTQTRPAGDVLGQYSRIWDYKANNGVHAALSLDYPYPEFHDLRVCYSILGWKFDATDSFEHFPSEELKAKGLPQHCVRVKMRKPNEYFGTLWFCSFDQDGAAVDPALESDLRVVSEKSIAERAQQRITDRLSQWRSLLTDSGKQTGGVGSILQVQLLILTHEPLPDVAVDEAQKLFVEGVTRLRAKCIELKTQR